MPLAALGPILAGAAGTSAAATAAAWGAIGAGTAAGASIYGANKQSGAAENAANAQTAAANHAADLQSQSAKDALAFQQRQAAQDQANFNATQRANYDQWRPREERLSSLGELVGLAPRNIPAYQDTANVLGGSSSGQQSSQGGSDPASYTLSLIQSGVSPDKAAAQTNQKFNLQTGSQAVYYPENNTIGLPNAYLAGPTGRPDSPAAWNITPRSGGGAAPKASTPNSLASYVSPMMAAPAAPTLQLPQVRYGQSAAPGSLAALIGRN